MAGRSNGKNGWALVLLILSGIVIGGFLGSLGKDVPYLKWLDFGYAFGMSSPLALDLKVMFLQFQISFDITVASILGIALAIFIYRKL